MTKLSVNINKIATLRNARGGNRPNVVQAALDCERFGAQGITVHPRPDERHIRYQDFLRETITDLQAAGCRVSIFVDPVVAMVEGAAKTGTDRIELYTESYA